MLTRSSARRMIKLQLIEGALGNGVRSTKIKVALLHATAYCGIPAGLEDRRDPVAEDWPGA